MTRRPPRSSRSAFDARVDPVTSLLAAALRVRAAQFEIAPAMIANRDDLSALAAWYLAGRRTAGQEIEVLQGWRRDAGGDMLIGALDGKLALRADLEAPDGASLVPL